MDDDGNMNFMWRGGSSDEEPNVNTQNGYIKNTNAGMQYSNKWNDKQTFNVSPKYNSQIYDNRNSKFTQTQYKDSVLNENSFTTTNVNRWNFKTNASFDVKLDSNNTLKLTTRANFYHTEIGEQSNTITTGETGTLKNTANKLLTVNAEKQSYSGTLLFKHRFKKARRTFSVSADWNLLNNTSNNYLTSDNQSYFDGVPSSLQKIDQFKQSYRSTQNLSTSIIYTEPLTKNYSLELSHQLTKNNGTNDLLTSGYSNFTGKYDVVVDSLSNKFEQMITVNRPGLKISYNSKKIKYNFGSAFGFTHFDLLVERF
jgi:hypothetical protein